jgi:hypothetical protein
MNGPVKRFLFRAPRVLSILFAAFVTVFTLDVFSEHYGFWETLFALGNTSDSDRTYRRRARRFLALGIGGGDSIYCDGSVLPVYYLEASRLDRNDIRAPVSNRYSVSIELDIQRKTSSCLSPRNHPRIGCDYLPEVEQEAIVVAPWQTSSDGHRPVRNQLRPLQYGLNEYGQRDSLLLNWSMPTSLA